MGTQTNESYIMTRNKFKSRKMITVTEKLINESKINPIKSDSKASFKIGKIEESNLGVRKCHSTVISRRRKVGKISESNFGVRKCHSTVVRRCRRVKNFKKLNLGVRKCHSTVVRRRRRVKNFKKSNLGVRKCNSTVVPRSKTLKNSNNNETLKIPKIPQKILRIINMLRHEEFLEMVSFYFQSSIIKQLDKMKYSNIISPLNSTISKANM